MTKKFPLIERTVWIGTKSQILKRFEEVENLGRNYPGYSKYKEIAKIQPQLDNIEETGFPGVVNYITENIDPPSPPESPLHSVTVCQNAQWVYVCNLQHEHFINNL